MEVNLCPNINSGQASCSVKCNLAQQCYFENQAIVKLDHSVTVVYQYNGEVKVKVVHPGNTESSAMDENCVEDNPKNYVAIGGEPSHMLNTVQAIQQESTHGCSTTGIGNMPLPCSSQSNSTTAAYQERETSHTPSSCPLCDSTYQTSKDLNEHLKTHCARDTRQCPVCDKILTSKGTLFGHLRTHSGYKPYVCGECDRGFNAQYQLIYHQCELQITKPESSAVDKNCAEDNPKNYVAIGGEPSHMLNTVQAYQQESTHGCSTTGISDMLLPCSSQSNYTTAPYQERENSHTPSSCPLCDSTYQTSKDLNEHLKTHCARNTRQCPVCNKLYSTSGSLFGHLRTHSGYKPYMCTECNQSYGSPYQLGYHDCGLQQITKPYRCRYCEKSFNVPFSRLIHERVHVNDHCCVHCKTTFNQKSEFDSHECVSVKTKVQNPSCNEELQDKEQLLSRCCDESFKPFVCTRCNKSFRRQSNLEIHTRIHTGLKPFRCKQCFKTFARNDHLKNHARIHSSTKPFQCSECHKTFSNVNRLRLHERTHTCAREYRCSVCDHTFLSCEEFKSHKLVHVSCKPYACTCCEKRFARADHLRNHERIHTGVKPFKCPFCEKAFARQDHLKNHERIHTGVKPYECKHCDKAFTRAGNLRTHERTHEQTHEQTHERSHDQTHERSHEQTHTGVEPYTCKYCQQDFSSLDYLKNHERTFHMENPSTHTRTTAHSYVTSGVTSKSDI